MHHKPDSCNINPPGFATIKSAFSRRFHSQHNILSNVFNRATVNCARLVHFDDDSCGSVLHQIDRPLEQPKQNLMEMLKANEQYSMFMSMIEKANLTSLLENQNRSLTVLVPKNDVFTEVKEYFDELAAEKSSDKLENLIKTHVIDGEHFGAISAVSIPYMNDEIIVCVGDIFRGTLLRWHR